MVLLVLVTVLLNGVFDAVVVAWLAGRRSQKALERWISSAANGDEHAQKTLGDLALFFTTWMGSAQLKTGKKVKTATDEKDDQGNPLYVEVDEVLTPIDLVSRTVGNYVIMKVKGQVGGTKTQLRSMLEGEAAQFGGLSPAAAKALTKGQIGPAVMELAMPHLMKRLNKSGDNISSGGAEWK